MIHITHCVNNQVHVKKSQFWENFTNWTIAHKTIHVFDRESFTNGPKRLKIVNLTFNVTTPYYFKFIKPYKF